MARAIEAAGFPQVLVTNEEFKVTDLDKLEKQLQTLLKVVQNIKADKKDIALMEKAERIREREAYVKTPGYGELTYNPSIESTDTKTRIPAHTYPQQEPIKRRQLILDDLIENSDSKEKM
ncbi:hypothetical protein D3C86_1674450 [compost metagenome]